MACGSWRRRGLRGFAVAVEHGWRVPVLATVAGGSMLAGGLLLAKKTVDVDIKPITDEVAIVCRKGLEESLKRGL